MPTRVPASPKTTQTTARDENEFLPQNLAYAAPNNSFDLESLLEEPINTSRAHSQSDDVEIIKSVGKKIPNDSEATPTPQDLLHEGSEEADAVTEDYDYDTTYASHTSTSHEENDVQHEDYPDHDGEDEKKIKSENKSGYDILINTPMKLVREDNFKQFIDTTVIDNSTDESLSLKSEDPISTLTTPSSLDVDNNTEISYDLESSNEHDYVYDEDESENISSPLKDYTSKEKKQNYEEEPKLVVSVVTTKSVVNNTIIASVTPPPLTTHKMTPPPIVGNTTDSWVVVASVQTSRSISGARYLPSPNVKQDERVKMLNEDVDQEDILEETTEETLIEEVTTISPTTTSSRPKTSTESLIDKLDRVQSDLSSGLLVGGFKNEGNNIAVITENMTDKVDVTTMLNKTPTSNLNSSPPVVIRKFSANARPPALKRPKKPPSSFKPRNPTTPPTIDINIPQGDEPTKNISLSPSTPRKGVSVNKVQVQDISAFLPPGYKLGKEEKDDTNTDLLKDILNKIKPKAQNKTADDIISKAKKVDISAFLPPGYKPKPEGINNKDLAKPTQQAKTTDKPAKTTSSVLPKVKPVSDISHLLPPGYKPPANAANETKPSIESILAKAKPIDDISALLPPGFKPKYGSTTAKPKPVEGLLKDTKTVDISAFLPPGYKLRSSTESPRSTTLKTVTAPPNLLPPGYNARSSENESSKDEPSSSSTSTTTTSKPGGFKVVFPSRPGGPARKKSSHRLTTPKVIFDDEPAAKPVTVPTIHKGWPSRATTEFTGWPSPSTTPISIERLLEAARASSTTPETSSTFSTSTQAPTTTTTTTTQRPTTPGVCEDGCDLASTIKLVAGVQWVPELLDRNTKEWQILANEVQTQLEEVYSRSNLLNKWYKTIRIDGFAEGSVLVDYVVELNDMGRKINTLEIKRLFHESLDDALTMYGNREGKALNESIKLEGKLGLGNFLIDPTYTDFIVLQKQALPPVSMEENVLLPQWAIAVIVIGLASLLFVIIFGVTVLVNRQKNAKKKAPTPLTEDMLNELNKNHMGGFDNYGADDLYNMEDVWNERGGYEAKIPKKQRSTGSIHDNSMSNLYDSWRSEWNGYYYNAYYGNHAGSSQSGYARRRSDYDTNF